MGTKNSGNSDAETTAVLSSHRDLIIKGPSGLLPDQDLKAQHRHHDHDENITVNIPRDLNPIKIKVESLPPPPQPADRHRDDRIMDVDQDHTDHDGGDGPKTPTGEQHKIPVNQACPPAPKKLWRPLKRRRTLFQNSDVQRPIRLVELSHDEIESLFPRRSTTTPMDNRNTPDDHHHHHHQRPGNIKKVHKANFTSLMSFR